MAQIVSGGGISVGFKVELEAVRAAMVKMDDDLADLTAINREAAQLVSDERKARVPYITGHFAKAAYVTAGNRNSFVRLRNTGRGSTDDYIGVTEFGGAVPRHQGSAKRKRFSFMKPNPGGPAGDGYYLYPAFEFKREAITEKYRQHLAALAAKYMP